MARLSVAFAVAASAALVAAAGLVLGQVLPCSVAACQVPAWDVAGLARAAAWRGPRLDAGFLVLTQFGSLLVLAPLAGLHAWSRAQRGAGRAALFVPLALAGSAVIAQLGKLAMSRPRPDFSTPLIDLPGSASFPSAHAMQATALAVAWILRPGAIVGPGPRALEALALAVLVLVVGTSRVYLQVHFPSDVVFGVVAGALWVLALRALPVWAARRPGND